MQTYDVIILPLAERDIARNTDYIFYEKKVPETDRVCIACSAYACGCKATIAKS